MTLERAETQYLRHLRHIYEHGTDLPNPRTGIDCRTVINLDMTYDASSEEAPILTTRKVNVRLAIAELLGYLKGFTSAAQFRELGCNSWNANANENQAWLANPNRKGEDDLGSIYGAVAKRWPVVRRPSYGDLLNTANDDVAIGPFVADGTMDLIRKVYENLRAGKDDRGEIISFYNPGMFALGCLRPCMYEHQFSLLGEDLYLNSTQRSSDWCLGTAANMIQAWLLLRLMAQITGKNPKIAHHRSVNCHIYRPQLDKVGIQLDRQLLEHPSITINPDIRTLEDVESWVTVEDFHINYPEYHPPIKYPFAV